MNKTYNTIPNKETINETIVNLQANGFIVSLVENLEEAKAKVLELIPEQSEVMTYTSVTLDESGISTHINESGDFKPNRDKLYALDRETQGQEMRTLGSVPEFGIGSVHAITQAGQLITASATGSQLPGQAFGAEKMIVVAGVQKITKDLAEGMERIENYTLPLESERARKAYGVPGSAINKVLIINREVNPNRFHIILINQNVGY
jgi:LUD domain